ncbi:hypothetical protein N0V84_003174 [Fusarium piperis]|uniref:SET domain-containing protein n=1 Tax=Fusarium piperis TaxID=1435070 RepID=A0A9W8WI86_9HYPO|nr:hypothetical protein N0V84_003174 [Fusarium piperis]
MSTGYKHPYLSIPLPEGVPFELKKAGPRKGWGAYATKPIRKGDLIVQELPMFLTEQLTEASAEAQILTASRDMSLSKKRLAILARDNGGAEFDSIVPFFLQNSFSVGEERIGFYLIQSRFNHSCQPNSSVPTAEDNNDLYLKRYALEDIKVGEEITFCYQPGFNSKTRLERQKLLTFECLCKCCTRGKSAQQLSDLRRTFIKALDYLAFGAFPDGTKDRSDRPLICDPALKRACESQDLPISNKFVYHILYMCLAEQEKLMSNTMLERISPKIDTLARIFETESNIIVSELALSQTTWLKKLDVALTILGEPDEADEEYNVEVRRILDDRRGQNMNRSIY